ncbi:N-acetyl sugar amidotransferase [Gammaproteobacteria bacterium]|nr:N-acetyl sugar amidotransferase [Gammaproteobacteria bacterium]MDA9973596.1 N-acetyl sugar amidotransferase [Gammaproteobacteria bacterium]
MYKICQRCVMDTSDPLISFDQEGYCNLCTDFLENRQQVIQVDTHNEQPLIDLFKRVKSSSKNRKYDCIIGISGGVDSSALAVLAHNHGLRILAVHLDNGWNSPIAVSNIKSLVKKLDIDYSSYVLPWSEFKRVQLAFLKASVPEAETPTDVAIGRATNHYALKTGTKFILSGGNIASEGILPMSWHYNCRDTKYSHEILKQHGSSKRDFSSQKFGFASEFYCKIIKNIKYLYPLNYTDFNKQEAQKNLENNYDWKFYGSKHGESRYTKFIQRYYLIKKHGIDYRRATFSSEICLKKISREQALATLEIPAYSEEEFAQELEYIAKKLSISKDDLVSIINAEPKWFFDYKNNMFFLHKLYDFYRLLYGQKKTSNH